MIKGKKHRQWVTHGCWAELLFLSPLFVDVKNHAHTTQIHAAHSLSSSITCTQTDTGLWVLALFVYPSLCCYSIFEIGVDSAVPMSYLAGFGLALSYSGYICTTPNSCAPSSRPRPLLSYIPPSTFTSISLFRQYFVLVWFVAVHSVALSNSRAWLFGCCVVCLARSVSFQHTIH